MKPLAIDLFCGLGGWTEGLLAEGYRVIGFDIERHHYGDEKYPAQLVLQDVLTIHGSQFKGAALIVASPPCQAFSWRSMPWKLTKAKGPDEVKQPTPIWWKLSESDMSPEQLAEWTEWKVKHPREKPSTALFDACFRIQREATRRPASSFRSWWRTCAGLSLGWGRRSGTSGASTCGGMFRP